MKELESELKRLLIDVLNLEDIEEADIDSAAPLFGDGLGLDSIDALELGVAVRQTYNVELDAESAEIREHFGSISNLARFISTSSGSR
jgi:acyl carrier protein